MFTEISFNYIDEDESGNTMSMDMTVEYEVEDTSYDHAHGTLHSADILPIKIHNAKLALISKLGHIISYTAVKETEVMKVLTWDRIKEAIDLNLHND